MDNLKVFNNFGYDKTASNFEQKSRSKEHLSKKEIRDKVEQHFSKKAFKERANLTSKGQRLGAGFMKLEGEEMVGPQNEMTRDKLKNILQTGAFNFNDKEKVVLDKILGAN